MLAANEDCAGCGRFAIEAVLPHRAPFLLVDTVIEIKPGKWISAVKRARRDDWWAGACPPGGCAMPHSLVLEALAQTGGILLARSITESRSAGALGFLARIRSCTFGRYVYLGDEVRLVCHLRHWRRSMVALAVRASVDAAMVVDAELALVIKFGGTTRVEQL